MRPPRAILFDLGDTLLRQLSFDPLAGTARQLEFARNPRHVSPREVTALIRELDADILPRREQSTLEFHSRHFQRLLYERLGISFELSSAAVELEYWKASMRMAPEPGIRTTLDALRERRLPMGVVSNATFSGDVLAWELARHGLDRYFRFVMSSADYGLRKPNPLLILTAVGKLDLPPADVWFVGDKPDKDTAGARAAGLTGIWYNRERAADPAPPPDAEIHSWDEFPDLLP